MPLTDTALRNLKPNGTPTKLTDSEGLYLYLSPSGGKLWRLDYRYGEKRKILSRGAYPSISLREARRKRDDAKELLAHDIDPGVHKKDDKEAAEAAARFWRDNCGIHRPENYWRTTPDWRPAHAQF